MIGLAGAVDAAQYGGKAAALARALGAGLPVPPGFALSVAEVDGVAAGDPAPLAGLPAGVWAVRSSAVDEDGARASFAGVHATVLNVPASDVAEAVRRVRASGESAAARAYRPRHGLPEASRVAVVVQRMVAAAAAGVLFSRDPVTGEDVRVIEAAWGLGEAVVSGRVTPDRWRMGAEGRILSFAAGEKTVAFRGAPGGIAEEVVRPDLVWAPCLGAAVLLALHGLVERLDPVFPGPHDVEFAVDGGGALWLLQRRAITGGGVGR